MPSLKKIVVIGPESTGKSTLCSTLAAHYRSEWVPEYARSFLLAKGQPYNYDDLLTIARGQLSLEDGIASRYLARSPSGPPLLFIDTDMYVMKVWCEFVFGKCHQWIIDRIVDRDYDLYLLCRSDLPWTPDELREYPDQGTREKIFHIYKDILVNQRTPWVEIQGIHELRTSVAIQAVDSLFN
jgi:NadR type nicotinamide-nucleotide adenylyltransferase